MSPISSLALACGGILLSLLPARPAPAHPDLLAVERCFFVMGTTCQATAFAGSRSSGLGTLEEAFSELKRFDRMLSDYDPDSELSSLNAWPAGAARPCSAELFEILAQAQVLSQRTAGAFDPGIGALSSAWDLRGRGRIPSPGALAQARAGSGMTQLKLERAGQTAIKTHPRLQLDPGAFGKGAALERAAKVLRARGTASALLDFGGQILALGAPPNASGWRVGIAHPRDRSRPVAWLALREISAATSGQGERHLAVGGRTLGHILDPRSGVPVPAYGSVTVITPSSFDADALATALYVMGPAAGLAWAARHADLEALYLVQEGERLRARGSPGIEAYLEAVDPQVVIMDRPLAHHSERKPSCW